MFAKMLDLATNHLPQREMDAVAALFPPFEEMVDSLPTVIVRPYGAALVLAETAWREKMPERWVPLFESAYPNLTRLIDYAAANDCYWIQLDPDADTHEGLPTWDWETGEQVASNSEAT